MSEHNEIVATLEKYINGGRLGKSAVMKTAFAENATMYFMGKEALEGGAIQSLYDTVDELGAAPNLSGVIGTIDVNHTTATARIELFDWAGARYTDQMTLLKLDGEWKILHKVFHQH